MRREPSIDVPTFIPDDITEAYSAEAAAQVSESWSERPALAPVQVVDIPAPQAAASSWTKSPQWAAWDRLFLVLAVHVALVGWAVCTGWWAWLAYHTASTTWAIIAGAGAVALLLGLAASTRLWLKRDQVIR